MINWSRLVFLIRNIEKQWIKHRSLLKIQLGPMLNSVFLMCQLIVEQPLTFSMGKPVFVLVPRDNFSFFNKEEHMECLMGYYQDVKPTHIHSLSKTNRVKS